MWGGADGVLRPVAGGRRPGARGRRQSRRRRSRVRGRPERERHRDVRGDRGIDRPLRRGAGRGGRGDAGSPGGRLSQARPRGRRPRRRGVPRRPAGGPVCSAGWVRTSGTAGRSTIRSAFFEERRFTGVASAMPWFARREDLAIRHGGSLTCASWPAIPSTAWRAATACTHARSRTAADFDARGVAHPVSFSPRDRVCLPLTCMHCAEAWCLEVCPAGAISRDPETGAVVIDEDALRRLQDVPARLPARHRPLRRRRRRQHASATCAAAIPPACAAAPSGVLQFSRPTRSPRRAQGDARRQAQRRVPQGRGERRDGRADRRSSRRCAACATTAAASTCTWRTAASSTSRGNERPSLEPRPALRQGARGRRHGLPPRPAPARRSSARGDGWEEIPLEQALDEIAARLPAITRAARRAQRERLEGRGHRLRPAGGPGAPLHPRHRQSQLPLQRLACAGSARYIGYKLVDGAWPIVDIENARCVVMWGANPPHSHPNLTQHVTAARRSGRDARRRRPAAVGRSRGAPTCTSRLLPGHRRRPRLGLVRELVETRVLRPRTSSSALHARLRRGRRVRPGLHSRGRGARDGGPGGHAAGPWPGRCAAAGAARGAVRRATASSTTRTASTTSAPSLMLDALLGTLGKVGRHPLRGRRCRCGTSRCTTSCR